MTTQDFDLIAQVLHDRIEWAGKRHEWDTSPNHNVVRDRDIVIDELRNVAARLEIEFALNHSDFDQLRFRMIVKHGREL